MLKLALIIITILLVGCFATSHVMYRDAEKLSTAEVDHKLRQLEEEHKKLEEIKKELLERSKALSVEQAPPRPIYAPPAPPPAPVSRPSIASIDIEPIGSGSQPVITGSKDKKSKPTLDKDSVVNQLYEANAVFAIPNKANVEEEIRAQLIIDPLKSLEDLKKDATVGPVMGAEKIEISRIVIAKLDAPDFHIISATEPEQAIAETKSTEWLWTLKPKTSGIHSVNIVVYAEVTVGPKTTKYKIQTFDKQVMVEITPVQELTNWWTKNWQWVFVTLLIPFGKWLYDKKFNKPKEKADKSA